MKHIHCILISSLISISSYAQQENIEIAHFLFPEFTHGVVLMKNRITDDVLLNYNTVTEQMIFEKQGKMLAIAPTELGLVDTVFVKDRKFIAFDGAFVELLSYSKWDLYVAHECEIDYSGKSSGYGGKSKTLAIESYSSINSKGSSYQTTPIGYELNPYVHYWVKKNGNLNKFTSLRELKKLYKDKSDLFKAYVKKYNVKYDNQEAIIQLIEYLESN